MATSLQMFIALASILLLHCTRQTAAQCEGLRDGFYADTEQCDKYVKCVNQTIKEVSLCPDGLVFNEYGNVNTARCELPFNIDCTTRPLLQDPQPTKQCPRKYGMWADSADCGRFVQCADGTVYPNQCAPGLAFSDLRGICDWPENVGTCSTDKLVGFECPPLEDLLPQNVPTELLRTLRQFQLHVQTRHAHPDDCAQFHVCTFGQPKRIPRLLRCEYGRVFNGVSGECDEPLNVPGCEKYYADIEDENNFGTGGNQLA